MMPRSARLLCLVAGALLVGPSAGAVPVFPSLLEISVNGGTPFTVNSDMMNCVASGKTGLFACDGTGLSMSPTGQWTLSEWNIGLDQDPKISPAFTFTNNTGLTANFTLTFIMPVLNFGPDSLMRGSVGTTITDNGNGMGGWSTSSTAGGQAFYTGIIDNILITPNATLLPHLNGVNFVTGGQTKIKGDAFGLNAAVPEAEGLNVNIGINFAFRISPDDDMGVTSFFEVIPVPEPGTAALAGFGLLGLLAAGRRLRR